jgi:hypothetical protein
MAEKKSRATAETAESIPEQSDEQKQFQVRRNGYEHHLSSEEITQGDIVLIEQGDSFKFDAVLLEVVQDSSEGAEKDCASVAVNEEEVGTGRSKCRKSTVWKVEQGQLQDPFLLAGSKLLAGSAWALVCLVRAGTAKRNSGEVELGGILKLSSLSHQVEQVIRVAVVLLVAYLGLAWMSVESVDPFDIFLQLTYLVSCLTLYLSYANTSELLACLKKYLRQKVNGRGYRILNHQLLERLGEIDLLIVEDDCLAKNNELLSRINRIIDLKIVTRSSQKELEARFGADLNHELIFQPTEGRLLRETLGQLARSKFISVGYD